MEIFLISCLNLEVTVEVVEETDLFFRYATKQICLLVSRDGSWQNKAVIRWIM